MKKAGIFVLLVLSVYYFALAFFIGIEHGKSSKQREIENRAKKIEKEKKCITNQELKIIIFGEKQE